MPEQSIITDDAGVFRRHVHRGAHLVVAPVAAKLLKLMMMMMLMLMTRMIGVVLFIFADSIDQLLMKL